MISFMVGKLLATAKTGGTDVDAVSGLAHGVCTFYSDGVGKVAGAAVAFNLETGFVDGYYVIRGKMREKPQRGGEKN